MDRWLTEINDTPNLPEKELIAQLWEGKEEQPTTSNPEIIHKDDKLFIQSRTEGASIAYRKKAKDEIWQVYEKPLVLYDEATIEIIAHRIGYKPSEMFEYRAQ